MELSHQSTTIEGKGLFASPNMKTILSTLWLFLLLNMLFRDIHEIFRQGFMAELMNGTPVTEMTLLIAGMVLELLIAMVVLSRVLNYRVNRWMNIIVAVMAIGLVLSFPPNDLDDIFFASVEVLTLVGIIGLAWRWRIDHASKTKDAL